MTAVARKVNVAFYPDLARNFQLAPTKDTNRLGYLGVGSVSGDEIERLAALIKAIARRGTGVLLVEHHADLIFDICDQVTVLNLRRTLAAGTPAEIRVHEEVVSAYLGA